MTAAIGMHWNSNESAGTEIDGVDENKTLTFNQKLLNRFCSECAEPRWCNMLSPWQHDNLQRQDRTLMEDPEERLEEVILNGVALRPRVNSETGRDANLQAFLRNVEMFAYRYM